MIKPETYYDFDYLEEQVKKFRKEFRKPNVIYWCIRRLPERLFFWSDLHVPSKTYTNGKEIVPEHNYVEERELFINYLVKKYGIE